MISQSPDPVRIIEDVIRGIELTLCSVQAMCLHGEMKVPKFSHLLPAARPLSERVATADPGRLRGGSVV